MRLYPTGTTTSAFSRKRGRFTAALLAFVIALAPLADSWAAAHSGGKPGARQAGAKTQAAGKNTATRSTTKAPAPKAGTAGASTAKKSPAKAGPAKTGTANKSATPKRAAASPKAAPAKQRAVASKAPAKARSAPVAQRPQKPPAVPPLQLVNGKPVVVASVAYVVDQDTGKVLLGKNASEVRPIASLTKLMTGLVVAEAKLPLDERITITAADVDRLKGSSSRLPVGTQLTRRQALHLSLMSSENRAAHALARTYPGGTRAFVSAMNNMARQLGMDQTRYVDPTGLSSGNQSNARDLALLTRAAHEQPLLRRYSTSPGYQLAVGNGKLQYVNSNALVRGGEWDIGVQKTGYISEAGRTLVVQTQLKGRNLIMVFLDSATKISRIRDAEMVRRWLRTHPELAGPSRAAGEAS